MEYSPSIFEVSKLATGASPPSPHTMIKLLERAVTLLKQSEYFPHDHQILTSNNSQS
jgi:hypothetical protein